MTAPVVELCQAVVDALATEAGKTVARSYAPYVDASSIANGAWFCMPATEETQKARFVDKSRYEVDLNYLRSLPASTAAAPKPLENNVFLDACMAEVESVKALFREGGALAAVELADNWVFQRMTNSPMYERDALRESQIFVSFIRLEFLAQA